MENTGASRLPESLDPARLDALCREHVWSHAPTFALGAFGYMELFGRRYGFGRLAVFDSAQDQIRIGDQEHFTSVIFNLRYCVNNDGVKKRSGRS